MRWISNTQSAENREISVVAIVETILSGLLAYLYYRWTNSLWHIGAAACLAPFLLLRTSRTTAVSLGIADAVYGFVARHHGYGGSLSHDFAGILEGPSFFLTPLVIAVVKFISTCFCFIIHPLESIREIPRNWQRVVLCTDVGAIPELIPTIEKISESSPLYRLKASAVITQIKDLFLDFICKDKNPFNWIFLSLGVAIMLFFITILLVFPGLAYRYAVKSTAVIWSPLLWAVRPVSHPADLKLTMNRILTRNIYKASRIYSAAIVTAFIGKMYLWLKSGEISPTVLEAARPFIVPDELPLWHVTSAFNAMASWCLYFLSDYYYKEWQQGIRIPENALRYTFLWLPFIMNIFAIYAIFCAVYITVQVTSNVDLPPLHAKLFPWW
jgi:hypothetical protein